MRKMLSWIVLLIFLAQVAYLTYRLPQLLLIGGDCPETVKLSAVSAGICLGVLYMLKGDPQP